MNKKLGTGSISLIFVMLALLWSCNIRGFCIGDFVLNHLGLPAWSEGTSGMHYTVFWGLPLYITAFLLGHRYPSHLFAHSGKWLSACIGGGLLVIGTAMVIW